MSSCGFNQTGSQQAQRYENSFQCQSTFSGFSGDSFPNLGKVSKSRRKQNMQQDIFQCEICHKILEDKFLLDIHKRVHAGGNVVHTDQDLELHREFRPCQETFACNICETQFSRKSYLRRHIASHKQERPHECEVCSRRFTRKEHLLAHERSHSGDKPYICKVCNKGFTQSSSFRRHQSTHT